MYHFEEKGSGPRPKIEKHRSAALSALYRAPVSKRTPPCSPPPHGRSRKPRLTSTITTREVATREQRHLLSIRPTNTPSSRGGSVRHQEDQSPPLISESELVRTGMATSHYHGEPVLEHRIGSGTGITSSAVRHAVHVKRELTGNMQSEWN
jgi:hypothetical protein